MWIHATCNKTRGHVINQVQVSLWLEIVRFRCKKTVGGFNNFAIHHQIIGTTINKSIIIDEFRSNIWPPVKDPWNFFEKTPLLICKFLLETKAKFK
jgi:hypothetical protein